MQKGGLKTSLPNRIGIASRKMKVHLRFIPSCFPPEKKMKSAKELKLQTSFLLLQSDPKSV